MAKVLVPLDGTDASREALPLAEQIAREMSAELVLVSVTELPETAEQAETARRDAAASLRALLARP